MEPGITLCASLLAGGYERFSSEFPEFCAKTKSLSNVSPPTSAEPLDFGCGSCGTPLHDQVCLEAHCSAIFTALSSTATWSCWRLCAPSAVASRATALPPLLLWERMVVLLITGCFCALGTGQTQILLTTPACS